jgi:hypothetical protein
MLAAVANLSKKKRQTDKKNMVNLIAFSLCRINYVTDNLEQVSSNEKITSA